MCLCCTVAAAIVVGNRGFAGRERRGLSWTDVSLFPFTCCCFLSSFPSALETCTSVVHVDGGKENLEVASSSVLVPCLDGVQVSVLLVHQHKPHTHTHTHTHTRDTWDIRAMKRFRARSNLPPLSTREG